MGPVAAWYVSDVLLARRRPRTAYARTHRFQDRHQLRLPRRLVGRLQRQTDDRRLGRPPGWRAGARSCGPDAAAPILFDAFARLKIPPAPLPRAPYGLSSQRVQSFRPVRHFSPGDHGGQAGLNQVHILFPPDGARL